MDNLVEKNFIIGEDKFHSQMVKNSLADNWSEKYINQKGHLVYIESLPQQPIIASVYFNKGANKSKSTFLEVLKTINPTDYNSILILVTTYPRCLNLFGSKYSFKHKTNTQLDEFLGETNGLLLYNYQLQNLIIMATGCDSDEANAHRKSINKKMASSFAKAKSIKLFGTTLYEIITQRAKFLPTHKPQYHSAYLLYESLRK